MILSNTTFLVHASIDNEFLEWMRRIYVTTAIESGVFSDPILTKILIEQEPGYTGYALQMKGRDNESSEKWHQEHAPLLKAELTDKYGEKLLSFTTHMEILPL